MQVDVATGKVKQAFTLKKEPGNSVRSFKQLVELNGACFVSGCEGDGIFTGEIW